MVDDLTFSRFSAERQSQNKLLGYPSEEQTRMARKTKSAVQAWIAKDDAALRAKATQFLQPALDKRSADTLALQWRHNRHRPEAVPTR